MSKYINFVFNVMLNSFDVVMLNLFQHLFDFRPRNKFGAGLIQSGKKPSLRQDFLSVKNESFQNILFINFGGIGDEILFLPVISAVKKKYPEARAVLCLEERSRAFLDLTNLIDDYFYINIKTENKYAAMFKLWFKAVSGGYDAVISSGSNPLIALLLFFTGIKTRIGYDTSFLSKKLLTHPVKLNKNKYAAQMYYDLAACISDIPFELPALKPIEAEKEKSSVLVHPGVSRISIKKNIIKTVSADVWAEIIIKLLKAGKKVSLAGGADDDEIIEKIRAVLKNQDLTNFIDMYGRTKNITDLAVLIKKAEILVCSDSAPMHIGIALKTKTAAIFGPTNEKLLMPESSDFLPITNKADCRPCLWNKRQTSCSALHCLKFNMDEIVKKILTLC